MGVMEAVKKGFGITAKSLGLVVVLFVFNLIGNLLSMPFAAVTPGTNPTAQLTAGALIFSLVYILVSIFFQGASLAMVRDVIKEGKLKLANFVSGGLKYYLKLFLLGLLIILIIAIIAVIAGLLVVITAPLNNSIVTAIAVIIAIAITVGAGIMYFLPLSLSPYALICEDLGVMDALKKSLKVAKTPFVRVFYILLLFVVLILISLGIGFVVGFVVGLISFALPVGAGKVLMAAATSAINGYLGVVMMASFMVYYLSIAGSPAVADKSHKI